MKKNSFYGMMLLSAAVLLMAGCTVDVNGDQNGNDQLVPLTLTSTVTAEGGQAGAATRAATNLQSAQLDDGETFQVCFTSGSMVASTGSVDNFVFTANGDGTIKSYSPSQPFFARSAASTTISAYHGKSGGTDGTPVTNATTTFSVAQDQSTDAAYKASDLMYATAYVTKQRLATSASLPFTHQMAKIVVNIMPGSNIDISAIRIVGGSRTISIANATATNAADYLGTTLTDALSSQSPLLLYSGEQTTGNVQCAGLIPPQTITGDFMEVVTPTGTATFSLIDKAFAGGQSYIYNINITAATIGVTTDITDWDGGSTQYLYNNGAASLGEPEAVDLGIIVNDKKVLFANINVGASSPEDYGLYFAWGETTGHTATDGYNFDFANYKWGVDPISETYSKYVPSGMTFKWGGSGSPDGKLVLDPEDDAATANWGSKWRMPTEEELYKLKNTDYCTWTWQVSPAGYWVQSKIAGYTNNKIFLPAAGLRGGTDLIFQGEGWYRGRTLESNQATITDMHFSESDIIIPLSDRCAGATVRPVQAVDLIPPVLGDKYYSDGSWGNNPHISGATVIGIVAWLGSDSDLKCGKKHGLVMALNDVSPQQWGPSGTDETFLTNTSDINGCRNNDKNGLTNTDNLIADSHTHNAASAARAYTPAAPSTSGNTNWFLPSMAQWLAVMGPDGIGKQTAAEQVFYSWFDTDHTAYNNINNALTATGVGGTALDYFVYWSSLEINANYAVRVWFAKYDGVEVGRDEKEEYYGPHVLVRAFLAF